MTTIFKFPDFKFYLNGVLTTGIVINLKYGRYIDISLRDGRVIRDVDIYKQRNGRIYHDL